jgi:hypothetical protein
MTARGRGPDDDAAAEGRDPSRRDPWPALPAEVPESFDDETRQGMGFAPSAQAAPVAVAACTDRSEPIVAISMKDHFAAPRVAQARVPRPVQLRSLAEVSGRSDTPVNLGRLAPPLDPQQVRAPRRHDKLVWSGVALVLACAIALAIWLVAGR